MYWETSVDELQRFGPVILTRRASRWQATWQVLVQLEERGFEHWPVEEGQTPAEAVTKLWTRFSSGTLQIIFDEKIQRMRWNGVWKSLDAQS